MATLTTLDGRQFNFAPSSVTAVVDHDLSTGDAVTCIYGIAGGTIKIAQPVDDFLASLGALQDNFVPITLLNGLAFFVSAPAVKSIRQPEPGEYADTVNSVISVGGLNLAVRDSIDTATAAINAHGGRL